ncbi:hypothetical protein SeMB42_g05111 [Synchytrium endobioticum]|uniref:Nucleoporin Nup186/Nup192/Nup205 n=1 Tax=Synchytrium endobioticum TaxID=286115 RepID=A0A507CTH1_9FUNG|nr:hypothetical protein SeMB42_g05111 [Synchytrium endobioticum]
MAKREFDYLEDFAQLVSQITHLNGHVAVEHLKLVNSQLPRFVREVECLLREPPKDPSLRHQASKGTIYLNQQACQANELFCQTLTILSDLLDLNESRATSLLAQAQVQAARFDRDVLMTAVLLYHRGRRYIADTLVALYNFALDDRIEEPIRRVISSFVDDIIEVTTADVRGTSPITSMLQTVDELKKRELAWSTEGDGGDCDGRKTADIATRIKTAGLGSKPETLIQTHIAHIGNARKDVATIIWASARYRQLTAEETVSLLAKIRRVDMNDPIAFFLVTSFLAAETTPPYEVSDSEQPISDEYVADVERELIPQPWVVKELQNIICFRWAVYLRHEVSRPGSTLTVTDEHIQQLVKAAITQGALHNLHRLLEMNSRLLTDFVQSAHTVRASLPRRTIMYLNDGIAIDTFDAYMAAAFRDAVDDLVASLARKFGRIVKELKNHDEDIVPRPVDTFGQATSQEIPEPSPNRRDFEYLLKLIGLAHSFQVDTGYSWWTEVELCKFLKWSSEVRTEALVPAYLEMLASLANGPQSSSRAYEFLSATDQYSTFGQFGTSRVSWIVLFRTINQYSAALAQAEGREISRNDAAALCAYLRILRNVVHFDESARTTLHQNQHYRAVYALLQLFVCRVSIDVKASLLDAVAAFCLPVGTGGDSITIQVWRMLEQAQIIPSALSLAPGHPDVLSPGLIMDLEEVETNEQRYPETTALLRLLNTLMKSPTITQIVQPGTPLASVPGAPEQIPPQGHGLIPYARYVLERLLYRIDRRPFAHTDEKWNVIKECLEFANSCLVSFEAWMHEMDLTRLSTPIGSHPAIDVYQEVFSGRQLLVILTQIIGIGVETVNERKFGNHHVESVTAALHIFNNILKTQRLILDSLKAVSPAHIASLSPLDDRLSHSKKYVIDIAGYVSCTVGYEIPLIAVKILADLSQSSSFIRADRGTTINQLVSILDTSPDKKRTIYGFMNHLEAEDDNASTSLTDRAAAGNLRRDVATRPADVRTAIFEVLLQGLTKARSSAFAIFLLGFSMKLEAAEIPDPQAEGATLSCFHSVVRLANSAGPGSETAAVDPIPEKALHVLYILSRLHSTSRPTLRYLRHHESFVSKQLATLPIPITMIDEENAHTRHERALAESLALHQQGWIMDITAIELRLLQSTMQQSEIDRVLQVLLYTSGAAQQHDDELDYREGILMNEGAGGGYEQSLPRVLELLTCISLDRVRDQVVARPLETRYFGLLQLQIRMNEHGEEIYDVNQVLDRLNRMASQIDRDALGSGHVLAMRDEMRLILEGLVEKNLEIESSGAATHALMSWSKLMDFIARAFMSSSTYVDVIKLILNGAMSKAIQAPIHVELASAFAPVIEGLIMRLVEHLATDGLDGTYQSIARAVLDFFIRNEQVLTPPARASILSCSNQLFQLIMHKRQKPTEVDFWSSHDGEALSTFATYWKQLVVILCRDASDGDAVVMVPALALLDTLCSSVNTDDATDIITTIINRNALATFVESITLDDELVIRALTEAENFVPIFIAKIKLQMLVRIAQSRDGVIYLLNNNLLGILTRARFLDHFQEGSGNPELFKHFAQITHVVFELILEVLEHTNKQDVYGAVADFTLTHVDTFRAILCPPQNAVLTMESLRAMKYGTGLIMLLRKGRVLLNRMGGGAGRRTLHGMMVSLLDKLANKDTIRRQLKPASAVDDFNFKVREPLSKRGLSVADLEAERLLAEIQYNVLVYCLSIGPTDSAGEAGLEVSSGSLRRLLGNNVHRFQCLAEDRIHVHALVRKTVAVGMDDLKEIVTVHSTSSWNDLTEGEREQFISDAMSEYEEGLNVGIRATWSSIEMLLVLMTRLLRRELPQRRAAEDMEGLKRDLRRVKQQMMDKMSLLPSEERHHTICVTE